jgi:hypothetical protein
VKGEVTIHRHVPRLKAGEIALPSKRAQAVFDSRQLRSRPAAKQLGERTLSALIPTWRDYAASHAECTYVDGIVLPAGPHRRALRLYLAALKGHRDGTFFNAYAYPQDRRILSVVSAHVDPPANLRVRIARPTSKLESQFGKLPTGPGSREFDVRCDPVSEASAWVAPLRPAIEHALLSGPDLSFAYDRGICRVSELADDEATPSTLDIAIALLGHVCRAAKPGPYR